MRFGLSDLEELPSLKEFEQLAQAALGSDEGVAPIEPEGAPMGETGTEINSADPELDSAADGQSIEMETGETPAAAAEGIADAGVSEPSSQANGTSA